MGYAPNDRIELLEKETEIKNKSLIIAEWFGTIYLIYTVTLLLVLPAAVIVDIYRTVEGVPEFEVNNIFYFFWFLFLYIACVTFLTPVFAVFLPRKCFKVAYYFTMFQMTLLVFWIIGFYGYLVLRSSAIKMCRQFIIPISLQVFFIPLLFINTYICAQVYLIISKLRPEYDGDDLYEVIEGSEGSSTKKTDD